jgi:hypothetical protein
VEEEMIELNKKKLPKTRYQAIAEKSKSYFTGKPCIRGHVDARNTKNGTCNQCHRESNALDRKKIRDLFEGK